MMISDHQVSLKTKPRAFSPMLQFHTAGPEQMRGSPRTPGVSACLLKVTLKWGVSSDSASQAEDLGPQPSHLSTTDSSNPGSSNPDPSFVAESWWQESRVEGRGGALLLSSSVLSGPPLGARTCPSLGVCPVSTHSTRSCL